MSEFHNWGYTETSSLFERIRGESSGSSHSSRMDALINSIKKNLDLILNSRPLACQGTPWLGIPDLNDATQAAVDFKLSLENSIRSCIITYEPRISDVVVKFMENDMDVLSLQFNIMAFIDLDNRRQVIEFNMHLDNNRRYQLK